VLILFASGENNRLRVKAISIEYSHLAGHSSNILFNESKSGINMIIDIAVDKTKDIKNV
jgi:hypothetical protein